VLNFYNRGGGAGIGLSTANQTLSSKKPHLTPEEKKDIISFLNALTDKRNW
jgi:cytochrome c peroxidase